jgi:3-oxoacyl-[acyl-carrier protein] reductase
VAVVSGGTRGLGGSLVTDLLASGYAVATFSRSRGDLVERSMELHGDGFLWLPVDGGEPEGVKRFVAAVEERFGRIDVLVNNAGLGVDGLLTLVPEAEIERGLAVNLGGAIRLTRGCLKSMLRQRSGCVINISSVNGLRGHSGVSVYSATKAALDGFTRSLAREVGAEGIRVNSVAPGYFESDMTSAFNDAQRARIVRRTPLGRLGTVDDLLGVVRFLISPAAAFVTGQVLAVDGGLSC